MEIVKKSTPNFTIGREGKSVKKIVVHWIGQGTPETAIAWFSKTASKVSAHYLVADDKVYQFVQDSDTAWHAGNWGVNTESIGIEHYGTPDHPISELTYKTSAALIKSLCDKFNFPVDTEHIISHKSVVPTQCPGTLDLNKLITLVKENSVDEHLVKIEQLEKDLDEMRDSRDKWKKETKEWESKYVNDVGQKDLQIESMQKSNAELTAQLSLSNTTSKQMVETLNERISTLTTTEKELREAILELEKELSFSKSQQYKQAVQIDEYKKVVKDMEGKIKHKLFEYSRLELLKIIFSRR